MGKKITRENIVKEINYYMLLNNMKEKIKEHVKLPGVKIERLLDTNEVRYKCPNCGVGYVFSGSGRNNIVCTCGYNVNFSLYSYYGWSYIEYAFNKAIEREEKTCETNGYILIPVEKTDLKGAILFGVIFKVSYVNDILNFSFELDDKSDICYLGMNSCRYFRGSNNSKLSYYNCPAKDLLILDNALNKFYNVSNMSMLYNYYRSLRVAKKPAAVKSTSNIEYNKQFSYLNLKAYKENVCLNYMTYAMKKIDYESNTHEFDVYCPYCKNHFSVNGPGYTLKLDECPLCHTSIDRKSQFNNQGTSTRSTVLLSIRDNKIVAAFRRCNIKHLKENIYEKTYGDINYIYTIDLNKSKIGQTHLFYLKNGYITKNSKNVNMLKSCYTSNVEYLNDDVQLKYTKIKEYVENGGGSSAFYITKYLILAIKYPIIEKLCMLGFYSVINEIIENKDNDYVLTANTVEDFFKVPKYIFKISKKHFHCAVKTMRYLFKISEITQNNSYKDADICYAKNHYLDCRLHIMLSIAELTGSSFTEQLAYIERVRVNQCIVPAEALMFWHDYLKAAQKIGANIKDKKVLYPSSLKREHDIVAYKASLITDEKQKTKFEEKASEYSKQYEWNIKAENYVIAYPHTIEELFEEGRVLNHCVGLYADSIIKGENIILFLRNKENPDVPFFTVGVDPIENKLTEIATFSNKKLNPTEEPALYKFLETWCERKKVTGLKKCV